jgi:hypothetical protein
MKTQINDLLRQTVNNVNNGHSIYTRDEVTNLLWTLQAKVEEFTETETEPVGRWFTQQQVSDMLSAFGKELIEKQIEYINRMDLDIDTDEIEIDDYDDFDIQIGSGNRIELTYEGQFRYNGESPNTLVANEIENEFDYGILADDVNLFMQNEISRQANLENDLVTLERGEVESSEFTVAEK